MWKGNHPFPPSNEARSLRRLTSLVKKLRSQGIIERYDQEIQDQIKEGIVERVTGSATGQGHFTSLTREWYATQQRPPRFE